MLLSEKMLLRQKQYSVKHFGMSKVHVVISESYHLHGFMHRASLKADVINIPSSSRLPSSRFGLCQTVKQSINLIMICYYYYYYYCDFPLGTFKCTSDGLCFCFMAES